MASPPLQAATSDRNIEISLIAFKNSVNMAYLVCLLLVSVSSCFRRQITDFSELKT